MTGLGRTCAVVKDTWQPDTPAESSSTSVFGGTAILGLRARVLDDVSVVVHGKYPRMANAEDRYVQAIGFEVFSAQAGIVLSVF